jgi:hypothetical protein
MNGLLRIQRPSHLRERVHIVDYIFRSIDPCRRPTISNTSRTRPGYLEVRMEKYRHPVGDAYIAYLT